MLKKIFVVCLIISALAIVNTVVSRTNTDRLSITATVLAAIVKHEGFRKQAYIPSEGDVPTIGFGTTTGVKLGDTITSDVAFKMLIKDAKIAEEAVKRCVNVDLFLHEYSAYVSLTHNIGETAFCNSTLLKKLNALDYVGACKEILRWNKQDGKVLIGLTKRRKQEYNLCIGKEV